MMFQFMLYVGFGVFWVCVKSFCCGFCLWLMLFVFVTVVLPSCVWVLGCT